MPMVARPLALLSVALLVGCSSQPLNPNTPSAAMTTAAAMTMGASIAGTVMSSSATSPLKVGVSGTSVSTMTKSEGHFTLSGVPAGHVTLRFEGSGVNAQLPLGTVQAGERMRIVVTVNGSNATLDSREDDQDDDDEDEGDEDEDEVEGRVSALGGSCPNLTFNLGSTAVKTNGNTQFKGVSCGALANGMKVEAEGTFANGVLTATEIERD